MNKYKVKSFWYLCFCIRSLYLIDGCVCAVAWYSHQLTKWRIYSGIGLKILHEIHKWQMKPQLLGHVQCVQRNHLKKHKNKNFFFVCFNQHETKIENERSVILYWMQVECRISSTQYRRMQMVVCIQYIHFHFFFTSNQKCC